MKLKAVEKLCYILMTFALVNLMRCIPKEPKSESESTANIDMYRNIEFKSQGAILRGRLYVPTNTPKKNPIVVMAHGFTTTINGMTADKYAEKFREAGFAVLLYDHRNFGISDGEPRQEINFWVQSRGYMDGIDFIITQPEINASRIAVWGASLSAREAFLVGSIDERVKAIINLIPAYGDNVPEKDKDGQMHSFAKETVLTERIKNLPHTVSAEMPIVSSDQVGTPSALKVITAYRWFIEYGGRYGTNWKNTVTFSNTKIPNQFHIGQSAKYLKGPILIVAATNDEMEGASNEVTNEIFGMIEQPKSIVNIDGGHFGLLHYPSALFDKASEVQIEFLNKYFRQ